MMPAEDFTQPLIRFRTASAQALTALIRDGHVALAVIDPVLLSEIISAGMTCGYFTEGEARMALSQAMKG